MRHRNAVGGAQTAEVPALHGALETFTLRRSRYIDELARNKVVRSNFGADFDEVLWADAELDKLALGFDFSLSEVAAISLRQTRGLTRTGTELERGIAILFNRAVRQHLQGIEFQHSHGDMFARVREDAGHAHLQC